MCERLLELRATMRASCCSRLFPVPAVSPPASLEASKSGDSLVSQMCEMAVLGVVMGFAQTSEAQREKTLTAKLQVTSVRAGIGPESLSKNWVTEEGQPVPWQHATRSSSHCRSPVLILSES